MATLLAGDTLVDDYEPLRVLVIDQAEKTHMTRDALAAGGPFFRVEECHSLRDGIETCRNPWNEVIILATDLPDSWPSDVFLRFSEQASDSPIIIIVESTLNNLSFERAARAPFCIIDRAKVDPTTIRRLVASAGILARTLRSLP